MKLIDAHDLWTEIMMLPHNGDMISSEEVEKAIAEAPTVDAKPVVHGRWIHPKGYVVSNGFKCSVCGHEEASRYPINPRPGGMCIADENGNFFHPPKINYCPNCGASMRDGGNENG